MLLTVRNGGPLDSSAITHHVFTKLGGADIVVSQMFGPKCDEHLIVL